MYLTDISAGRTTYNISKHNSAYIKNKCWIEQGSLIINP